MRRLSAILLTALIGLSLSGCSLFKKNTNSGNDAVPPPPPTPANNSSTPPAKFPTADNKSDPLSGQPRASAGNGLLAGRVVDNGNRPPGGTSILIVQADAKDDTGREVSVSPEGYFTIENLKPGGQYKLLARGRQGDRTVAGTHYATANNIHVLIQVKEDYVSSTTPAVSGPFGTLKDDKKFEPISPMQTKTTPSKDDGWRPGGGIDVAANVPANEYTLPSVAVPQPQPIAQGSTQGSGAWIPPPLQIPGPQAKAEIKPPEITKLMPAESMPRVPPPPPIQKRVPDPPPIPSTLGPAEVPSCVLVGRQLVNFALNDINGEPWELKTNRKGKLVLIDFWGTWCGPCRQTMPTLKGLQNKYGAQGLEVVGIAYEQGGTPQEQAYRVNDVCQKLLINYRQLLGSGPSCTLKSQLGIRVYPTLILLDDQGNIIYRHEGMPNVSEREELERLIQSKLRSTF